MSTPDRRALLERAHPELSVRRQCTLLSLARSGVYRPIPVEDETDLGLMRRIDELFLAHPFLGSRRMARMLSRDGAPVNRKRVQRLMRLMGIEALGPKPSTSKPAPGHKIVSLPAAGPDDRAAQPCLGCRYYVHSDRRGLPRPGGDHRLGEPGSVVVAIVEHDGHELLRGCSGRRTRPVRAAGDLHRHGAEQGRCREGRAQGRADAHHRQTAARRLRQIHCEDERVTSLRGAP